SVILQFPAALAPEEYLAKIAGTVTDLNGNPFGTEKVWQFTIPNRTTVAGIAQLENGAPVAGPSVTVSGSSKSSVTGSDGRFSLSAVATPLGQALNVLVRMTITGKQFVGHATGLRSVHKGITGAGIITMRETCDAQFARGLFPQMGTDSAVNC